MKKWLSMFLATVMLCGVLAGCGGTQSGSTPASGAQSASAAGDSNVNAEGFPIVNEPITLRGMVALNANVKDWKDIADKKGIKLACYLGHGGNFVHSREILDKLLKEVPEFNIKLDPVGIMRNMKDDPYEIMKRYANRIAHFHAKDIFRYGDDGWEIEPIVGMGQLKWNVMLGMLWNVGYDGYIIIEPHGDVWAEPENRWKHIVLAKRHLEQYMIR